MFRVFFAPAVGINEDPVIGSAHTMLIPYWAQQLGKTE
ncbi:MAG: PhzF family phenazine biosynthesis protein, partial [Draconibacterium sp.]